MNSGQDAHPSQGQSSGAPDQHHQQQQQQQQQQGRKITLFRPEQMRTLPPPFTDQEKAKYEHGLRQLYAQIEKNPRDSQSHMSAKQKLFDFSSTLQNKLQKNRMDQQRLAQQGGGGGSASGTRPPSQGQPSQTTEGSQSMLHQNSNSQAKPQISPKVMEHVNAFPYQLPASIIPNTPEAAKWLHDAKQRYLRGLIAMEQSTSRVSALDALRNKRNEEGKPLSPEEEKECEEKKQAAQKSYREAKQFVDNFRHSQEQVRNAAQGQQSSSEGQGNGNGNGNGGVPNTSQPPLTRPQMNPQQVPNPALQNTQTVNAAIEAAKNRQMEGPRPSMQQNGQMSQPSQIPNQNAPSHPNMPQQQGGQNSNIKMEGGGPPQLNTAITQMQQNRSMQNSPGSAVPRSAGIPQSATSISQAQIPQALSHSDALHQAARSYSAPQVNVMGHSHPQAPREAQNTITNKMPIPKHLPERAIAPPMPVQMSQARPTYSGGPGGIGNGVLNQPVLAKTPGYNMEGEGDRVLSKKKLDELVRQVTGGGQQNGENGVSDLTPDVEDSILTVADNFVDQVLQAACKNAKERGSKVLEIRDIQLTLERGYNIRIPGYSSDEIRTVRKIQPSNAWITKMSAVQAAKVTGGKNAD